MEVYFKTVMYQSRRHIISLRALQIYLVHNCTALNQSEIETDKWAF